VQQPGRAGGEQGAEAELIGEPEESDRALDAQALPVADPDVTDPGPPPAEPEPPGDNDEGDAGPPADQPEPEAGSRNRTARFAWWAVAIILIAVVVLVIYALTRSTEQEDVAHPAPTDAGVMSALASVPRATFDAVGALPPPSVVMVPPSVVKNQPPLVAEGRPEVLFAGADFCPFCAVERWPLIVALSRFGHFAVLHNMQSAPASAFPGIQTFTFTGTSYTSQYVTLTGVELYSDGTDADGVYTRIASLSPDQQALIDRYRSAGSTASLPGSYPFVDIGNKMVTSAAAFSPALLMHLSQAAIAGGLATAQGPAAQAIVAAANQLSAGICAATGQQPARVCASKGVRSASFSLGAH